MSIYEVSFETTLTTATANAPLASLRGDTTRRIAILEVNIFQKTAGTSPNGLGLARATNTPAGGTTAAAEEREPASTLTNAVGVVSGWTTAPTVSTIFKRWLGGTAVGNGYPFAFDRLDPFMLPMGGTAGGELVLVNLYATTPPIYVVNFTFDVE